jgi:hypothetical protein
MICGAMAVLRAKKRRGIALDRSLVEPFTHGGGLAYYAR